MVDSSYIVGSIAAFGGVYGVDCKNIRRGLFTPADIGRPWTRCARKVMQRRARSKRAGTGPT